MSQPSAGDDLTWPVLGLDFGSARTGVAVTDATGTIARPLEHVERAASSAGMDTICQIVAAMQVTRIVVGLPTGLAGRDTPQTARARSFADRLRRAAGVPVELHDERFTTRLAEQSAAASGSGTSRDSIAACHILTSWMESRRR
jgi:putative Holliday junction resolvase